MCKTFLPEVDLLLRPPCVKNLHLHLECANYAASIYTELKYYSMLLNLLTEYGGGDSGGNIKWAKECFLEGVTDHDESNEDFECIGDNDYNENDSGVDKEYEAEKF